MNQEKLKSYLKVLIRWLAIWTLQRYQPGVVGITGSVGKTSTKEAIHSVLKNYRRVRKSPGNFNGDLGLPLTILGDWTMEEFSLFGRENPL